MTLFQGALLYLLIGIVFMRWLAHWHDRPEYQQYPKPSTAEWLMAIACWPLLLVWWVIGVGQVVREKLKVKK